VGVGLALGGDLSGPLAVLLLLGYATAVALHAAAALRSGLPEWLALLLPFYWALHWAALLLALSDLVRDPAHWRKTDHGCTARPVVSQEPVEAVAALSAQ
jgi:glycosyltransferase XagB